VEANDEHGGKTAGRVGIRDSALDLAGNAVMTTEKSRSESRIKVAERLARYQLLDCSKERSLSGCKDQMGEPLRSNEEYR